MSIKNIIAALAGLFGYAIVRQSTLQQVQQAAATLEPSAQKPGQARPARSSSWDISRYFLADAEQPQPPLQRPGNLGTLSADDHYQAGLQARTQGRDDLAFHYFAFATALTGHEPAMGEMRDMGQACLRKALELNGRDDLLNARDLLVQAVEMDHRNPQARKMLARLLQPFEIPDLTKMCFIFYDGERADHIHREAYKRALEYVTLGGVVGDILEFGVLGGWSSRIFCEIMRDLANFSRIHLFDSFEGLPDYASDIDINSWEIGGRKIWADKMRFPDEFRKQFVSAHYLHIRTRLSEIIRRERILIHKGFYSETLKDDLPLKASIVHIDCDLYQSTAEVLWALYRMNAYQDGCVLLFDDWNCNRASPLQGERRAFTEFLDGQSRFTATPWFSYGYNGMAFHLHDVSPQTG
jgi:hypothetical protein